MYYSSIPKCGFFQLQQTKTATAAIKIKKYFLDAILEMLPDSAWYNRKMCRRALFSGKNSRSTKKFI